MKRLRSALLGALCALVLGACSSFSVDSNYDPNASFDGLRSYAWREPAEGAGDALTLKLVRDAADTELRARGYQPATSAPDFTIGHFVVVRQRLDVETVDSYYGYSRSARTWAGPSFSSTYVTTYDEGTILLDIANGATGEPMWRGSATGIVDTTSTPEERQARIREAIREVLLQFPPKK